MRRVPARRPVAGLARLRVEGTDRHPTLVWIAAAGLLAATLLGWLGMPPVDLHGPLHYLGIMGPLCGMTRSVARAATGDLARAWRYNPGGLLLVAGAWVSIVRALVGRLTGRWLNLHVVVSRGGWWALTITLAALTVNQQLHADLLR